MLKYYLNISVDDDFGVVDNWMQKTIVNLPFISLINGYSATIDKSLFKGRNFFLPIHTLLSFNKPISQISQEEFISSFSTSKYIINKSKNRITLSFDSNNQFDVLYAYIEKNDISRIVIQFINSPISSFCLLEEDGYVKIQVSPFTKDYYVMDDSSWIKFINYLTKEIPISEIRDSKIKQILNDSDNQSDNLIRQLKFYLYNNSNTFLNSVLDFYEKRGYITDKQFNAVAKGINWVCI